MTNPFDELGLKKELVRYLRDSGKLDDFLRTYTRSVQLYIHPDMGGSTDLSARVNMAFSEIRANPSGINSWIESMQNGVNPEYEAVMEGLVVEVERLKKVEHEHDELRKQHAQLLAERAGGEGTFERRRATPRRTLPRSDTFRADETASTFRTPPPRRPTPEPRAEPHSPPPSPSAIYAGYMLMPRAATYALGVKELRDACKLDSSAHPTYVRPDESSIYRPLTFKENIEARVKNFNTTHDKGRVRTMAERLFLIRESWNDSCTGIAYKAGTTMSKVIPVCKQLITIDKDFTDAYTPEIYDSLEGERIDSAARGAHFNVGLTKAQYEKNQGWRVALQGDKVLQKEYGDIVFNALAEHSIDKAMGFYVRQNTPKDELRALCVSSLDDNSYANGHYILSSNARFLRVPLVVEGGAERRAR